MKSLPVFLTLPKISLAAPRLFPAWERQAGASSGQAKTSFTSTRSLPCSSWYSLVAATRWRTASVMSAASASGTPSRGSNPRTAVGVAPSAATAREAGPRANHEASRTKTVPRPRELMRTPFFPHAYAVSIADRHISARAGR